MTCRRRDGWPNHSVGGIGQRIARALHHQLRDIQLRALALDDHAERTALNGPRHEIMAVDVNARDGEEERPGLDRPRIVGEVPYLADRDADDALRRDDVGQCPNGMVRGSLIGLSCGNDQAACAPPAGLARRCPASGTGCGRPRCPRCRTR